MVNEIFDKSKRTLKNRRSHVELNLKNSIGELSNYVAGERATDTKRGVYLQNVANYLLESPDIASGRRIKHAFYPSEKYYWTHSKTAQSTVLGADLSSVTYEKYQKETLADQRAYITRIFNAKHLGEREIRRFITLGMMTSDLSDYSQDMVDAICWLRSEITLACYKDGDVELLEYFDGSRGVVEVARKTRVSHQGISKKLKKICKNTEKRLRIGI